MLQILIAIDQLANALLGGWADETLSARAYRLRERRFWRWAESAINALFFDETHCLDAYLSEKSRRHSPLEERDAL